MEKWTVRDALGFLFLALILGGSFFLARSCHNTYNKTYEWPYDVKVEYQYQGEDSTYTYNFTDVLRYNRSVKEVDPKYYSVAGYNHELVVTRVDQLRPETLNGTYSRKFTIMNYTDKPVMVTNITWKCRGRIDK